MEIKPVYLFYGEETFCCKKISLIFVIILTEKNMEPKCFDGAKDSLDLILAAAEANPLFAEKRLIIVENSPWFKRKNPKGKEKVKRPMVTRSCSLIISHIPMKMPAWCLLTIKRTSA